MRDILKMLEADHRTVEQLLEELGATDEGPDRDRLVSRVTTALELHMAFEEERLYPLLQELDTEMATEAGVEHELTRDGLGKLVELAAAPGFGAVVDMLKGGIEHHVTEEESEAFPTLRNGLDAELSAALADELTRRKADAGVLADELGDATKEQLLEFAREADIPGRSSMSTDELRDALRP